LKEKPVQREYLSSYMKTRPPRIVSSFNRAWTFNYHPSSREKEEFTEQGYNDGQWDAVALPHTWMTYETTGDIHPYIKNPSERDDPYWWEGWGYYRKHFTLDDQYRDKKVFLEFDGVQKYSKVYVNGELVGDHKGGFTSFYFDITDHIRWNEDNLLAVSVNNHRRDEYRIPPMTAGNWNVYGGIYRDVRLVMKNKLHVPYQGSYKHEGGTFVTTPEISEDKARVDVTTYVKNAYYEAKNCRLITRIQSPEGKVIHEIKANKKIPSGEMATFQQLSKEISNPVLWSPENPVLYKVITEVKSNGDVEDRYESPLGFRWFHWDYETDDLYVNGEKINIKGTNRHQEYPWLGDAIPDWITLRDMNDIKFGLGHNFLRTAHYPNDLYVYDLNDQFGIITVEEVPNIKSIDFNERVQEQNLRELIRRDRNHPSIFFWSMGNETTDAADSRWAVEEDTTRIIHQRKSEDAGKFVDHNHENLDMEQLLRITLRGWFTEDDVEGDFNANPSSGQHAGTEAWQHKLAMVRGGSTRGLLGDNCVGWIYEDHGLDREYKNAPLKHINWKGWVDNYRIPRYIYFLTQATYTDKPMIFIHPHYWRQKYKDENKDIVVDANCDEVELFVNGESQGTAYPSENGFPTVTFKDVPIREGTLSATGMKDGNKVSHEWAMPGEPAQIVLSVENGQIPADRSGISVITAYILDQDGRLVFDATNELEWDVSGPGELVGPFRYQTDIHKHEAMSGVGYTVIPVSNVLRSTNKAGKINVKVTSPDLKSGEIEIRAVEPKDEDVEGIIQPGLSDKDRKGVERIDNFTEEIDYMEVLEPIQENYQLTGTTPEQWKQRLNEFILSESPDFNPDQNVAWDIFLEKMTDVVTKSQGELIADDYNFLADQFNRCMTLFEAIDISNLHVDYSQRLKEYYADRIIKNNRQIELQEEIKKIQNIPTDHVPVTLKNPTEENPEGKISDNYVAKTYTIWADSYIRALNYLFPVLKDYSSQEKQRVYDYIAQISPYVTFDEKRNGFIIGREGMLVVPGNLNNEKYIKRLAEGQGC